MNLKPYKDFKVLLVYPNFPMASVLLPAGVSILSAVIKKEGFQCKLFDTTLYKPKGESQEEFRKKLHQLKTSSNMEEKVNTKNTDPHDDFKNLIDSYKPDIVGISVLSDTFEMAQEHWKL